MRGADSLLNCGEGHHITRPAAACEHQRATRYQVTGYEIRLEQGDVPAANALLGVLAAGSGRRREVAAANLGPRRRLASAEPGHRKPPFTTRWIPVTSSRQLAHRINRRSPCDVHGNGPAKMKGYPKPENSSPFGPAEALARDTERLRRLVPAELRSLRSTNSFSIIGDCKARSEGAGARVTPGEVVP